MEVNRQLEPESKLEVEPLTGILTYSFSASWEEYETDLSRVDSLRCLLKYLLKNLNAHKEVVMFCEPSSSSAPPKGQSDKLKDDSSMTKRYKQFIKYTRLFRQQGKHCWEKMLEFKDILSKQPENPEVK